MLSILDLFSYSSRQVYAGKYPPSGFFSISFFLLVSLFPKYVYLKFQIRN